LGSRARVHSGVSLASTSNGLLSDCCEKRRRLRSAVRADSAVTTPADPGGVAHVAHNEVVTSRAATVAASTRPDGVFARAWASRSGRRRRGRFCGHRLGIPGSRSSHRQLRPPEGGYPGLELSSRLAQTPSQGRPPRWPTSWGCARCIRRRTTAGTVDGWPRTATASSRASAAREHLEHAYVRGPEGISCPWLSDRLTLPAEAPSPATHQKKSGSVNAHNRFPLRRRICRSASALALRDSSSLPRGVPPRRFVRTQRSCQSQVNTGGGRYWARTQ